MLDGHLAAGTNRLAAVILAGGRGARLGGLDKPMVAVGGVPMLARVVGAAVGAGAGPVVVVGPAREGLPSGVTVVREEPAGGGPVAAAAVGVAEVGRVWRRTGDPEGIVALLASDMPYLSASALRELLRALGTKDGALFVDPEGRRQLLCGVWTFSALQEAIGRFGEPGGGSLRRLVRGLDVAEVCWEGERAPYFDCDTEEDLRRVEP